MVTNYKKCSGKGKTPSLWGMKRTIFSVRLLLVLLSCQQPPEVVQQDDITFLPMATKLLSGLNVARFGHALMWVRLRKHLWSHTF